MFVFLSIKDRTDRLRLGNERKLVYSWEVERFLIILFNVGFHDEALAIFILSSKPPIWPSFLWPPRRVHLFPPPLLSKSECAGNRVRWAEVSITCTVV